MDTMVIGDLHEPFEREGYLEFCIAMKKKWKIKRVVFAGDLLDNHFASFHETDPDLHSGGAELNKAKEQLKKWFKAFPTAHICIGNHDRIPSRKAFNAGLSAHWVKRIGDVIESPKPKYDADGNLKKGWEFKTEFFFDGVLIVHGEGGEAKTKMFKEWCPVVQGHLHSKAYIYHHVSRHTRAWAMQVGTGINRKEKAFAYAKYGDRPHVSLGIILENGKLPIIEHMNLNIEEEAKND